MTAAQRKKQNQNATSDEEIIAALMNSATIQQAAEALKMAPRTIYDRMGTRDFRAAYSAAKSDLIRQATLTLNRNVSAAVGTITAVMNDAENPAAIRLQAAKMILENAGKFADRLSAADRYTAEQAEPAMSFDMSKW